MNITETMNGAYFTLRELRAPVAECCNEGLLMRLGVINAAQEPEEITINILANTFAVHFFNALEELAELDVLEVLELAGEIREFVLQGDYAALYYFISGTAMMMFQPVPDELICIAGHKDLLKLYLDRFYASLHEYAALMPTA